MTGNRHAPELLEAVAQALYQMAGSVEDLGSKLSVDPLVLRQHHVELQSIDLMCQTLNQIADLLVSDDPAHTLSNLRLEKLQHDLISAFSSGARAA